MLFQGIFLTQGANLRLLHCRWILYQLSPQGSPPKVHFSLLNLALSLYRWRRRREGILPKSHASKPSQRNNFLVFSFPNQYFPTIIFFLGGWDDDDNLLIHPTIVYLLSIMCLAVCQGLASCLTQFFILKLLLLSVSKVKVYCLLICGECLHIVSFNLCNTSKKQVIWLLPFYRKEKESTHEFVTAEKQVCLPPKLST